jgi:hypothetical protein
MPMPTRYAQRALVPLLGVLTLQGCIAYSVASTAVSVTGTVIETSADIVGGAVDLAIPDDDD